MKVFFTGATGVIGREAIPRLIESGNEVTGVTRSVEGEAWLKSVGAKPVAVDLFDAESVGAAVDGADIVFHFATSIPSRATMKKRSSWVLNDRLRTEATANLVQAAIRHDVSGFIQESISFFYADGRDSWIYEDSPIDPWWDILDSALEAERHVERFTDAGGTGVALRLSWLHGPGPTSVEHVEEVAGRRVPIVGSGDNYVSHLHIEDAGTALVAALDAPSGVYNVSEDNPVTAREDIETLAALIGAKRPRRVPVWLAKAAAGRSAGLLSVSQRVSNQKFLTATGWRPRHGSAMQGWATVVAPSKVAA